MSNRTQSRQDTQVRPSDSYNDSLPLGSVLETGSDSLESDLNSLRSMVKAITGESNWYDAPSASISSILTTAHENLDTLVHNISENAFLNITRLNGKVSDVTIWSSPLMTLKIREFNISRLNGKVSQVVAKQYNSIGGVVVTLTQAISRNSNGLVDSITYTEV